RRSGNAFDLLERHGKHSEGIVVAQLLLGRERQPRQIGERLQVVGMESGFLEHGVVMRHVVVGVPQRPLQAFELQRLQLVAARGLDRLQLARSGFARSHAWSRVCGPSSTWPLMRYDLPRKYATVSPR